MGKLSIVEVTAKSNQTWFCAKKQSDLLRICALTIFGCVVSVGVFAAVAPVSARGDDDKDSRHGHEDNDRGILAKIAALEAQVAALQNEVKTLQGQVAAVQSNHALLLGPFVNVDPNPEIGVIGPNIVFRGANIHIVSGSGRTDDNGNRTGLGNLIIGYDEDPLAFIGIGFPVGPGDRGGSHNLVIGPGNKFTQAAFGGLVGGEANTISNAVASVLSGSFSTASGFEACVIGGNGDNIASGQGAVVLGGQGNTASGFPASVLGGTNNTASGPNANVLGGLHNAASGDGTVVLGGQNVTDNTDFSIRPQPPFP